MTVDIAAQYAPAPPTTTRSPIRGRRTERGHQLYALAVTLVTDLEVTWAGYLGERKMAQLKRLLAELWDGISAAPPEPPSPSGRGPG